MPILCLRQNKIFVFGKSIDTAKKSEEVEKESILEQHSTLQQ